MLTYFKVLGVSLKSTSTTQSCNVKAITLVLSDHLIDLFWNMNFKIHILIFQHIFVRNLNLILTLLLLSFLLLLLSEVLSPKGWSRRRGLVGLVGSVNKMTMVSRNITSPLSIIYPSLAVGCWSETSQFG